MNNKNNVPTSSKKPVFNEISASADNLIGQIQMLISSVTSSVLKESLMVWLQIGRNSGDVGYLRDLLMFVKMAVEASENVAEKRKIGKGGIAPVIDKTTMTAIDHTVALEQVSELARTIESDIKKSLKNKLRR